MALVPWARRMQSEVEQLPDTLATLRAATANIAKVAEDLTGVAATLRQVTDTLDAAGLREATTMFQQTAEALRSSTDGMQAAQRSVADMNEAIVNNLAKLPGGEFWQSLRRPR